MIQLNLLPDVKLAYIKAQRSRRLVTTTAVVVSIGAVAILLLLLVSSGLQNKHLKDLTADISRQTAQLQKQPQISRILTVQNQLSSLTALHAAKPAAARLFTYLNQVTPSQVAINDFKMDFTKQAVTITGSADALSSVNKYVNTLKSATYTTDAASGTTNAFSNVVLSSFAINSGAQNGKPATYTLTLAYDKNLFDITQDIKLVVPEQVSNRPGDLFQAPTTTKASR